MPLLLRRARRTRSCAPRSPAARSTARSCASARPTLSTRSREAALDYAVEAPGRTSARTSHREELEALTYAVVDRASLGMAIAVDSALDAIRDKVEAGERLDLEDGLALLESDDLLALGELADLARRVRGGDDRVYFVQNLYLNQTNVCRVKCKFCAFAATQKQEQAYTISPDEFVADALAQRELTGFTEIHMVNGENPHVGFDFYVDTIARSTRRCRTCTSSATRRREIHHMTTLSGLTHEEVLRELKAAGLGSLPGGGAEVFADRVRRLVAPGKEHPDVWFHVHDTAHRLGIPTHCTMLYGHVETYEERDRPPAAPARPAGRDGRLPRVHPARVPSREHRLRAARLQVPDRARTT